MILPSSENDVSPAEDTDIPEFAHEQVVSIRGVEHTSDIEVYFPVLTPLR